MALLGFLVLLPTDPVFFRDVAGVGRNLGIADALEPWSGTTVKGAFDRPIAAGGPATLQPIPEVHLHNFHHGTVGAESLSIAKRLGCPAR
jgi:hypothetical protein